MKKLLMSTVLGTMLVVGVFAATNQTADTAMDAEPTVFSDDFEV